MKKKVKEKSIEKKTVFFLIVLLKLGNKVQLRGKAPAEQTQVAGDLAQNAKGLEDESDVVLNSGRENISN